MERKHLKRLIVVNGIRRYLLGRSWEGSAEKNAKDRGTKAMAG
jgi:hypothetical protein